MNSNDSLVNKAPQWFMQLHAQEKKELLSSFDVTDEEKFLNAFMSCDDHMIRRRAVERIKDQDRLWQCALNDPDPGVRSAAAVRLTDNDRLLNIVHNDADVQVRRDAAASITDREMLFELATTNPDRWIRKAAILAIQDDDDLMMIVFSDDEENELRAIAAQKVNDEECLKHIIRSEEQLSAMDHHNAILSSADLRRAAVLNLRDREMIRAIASDYSERKAVRIAAVYKLGENDQDILEMIAAKPYDPDPRRNPDLYYDPDMKAAAVSRLTNKELLRKYLDDPEQETRAAALLALGDQDILKETVDDVNWSIDIRKKALKKIKDQDFLYDFAMHHGGDSDEMQLAAAAVKKLFYQQKLADIAMGAEDPDVSKAAAECLHGDDDELLRIIKEIENHKEKWIPSVDADKHYIWEQEIKRIAASNLEDLKPLVRLTLKDTGDHYEIDNFKEYSIGLLSRKPDLMLDYVRREKDEWALTLAGNFSTDESVLQAIADKGMKDTYASYKIGYLRKIGEIGLKRKDEKVQLWKDVLINASHVGVRSLEEYVEGERVCLAKLMILWLYHSGTYFSVHVSDAEIYTDRERCKEIADMAMKEALHDIKRCIWKAEERAELKRFEEMCAKGAYNSADVAALVREALSKVYYDESIIREAEEEAKDSINYVRFKTYSLEEAVKDMVTAPYRSESSEPPPWLDEFEYIDWVITH